MVAGGNRVVRRGFRKGASESRPQSYLGEAHRSRGNGKHRGGDAPGVSERPRG